MLWFDSRLYPNYFSRFQIMSQRICRLFNKKCSIIDNGADVKKIDEKVKKAAHSSSTINLIRPTNNNKLNDKNERIVTVVTASEDVSDVGSKCIDQIGLGPQLNKISTCQVNQIVEEDENGGAEGSQLSETQSSGSRGGKDSELHRYILDDVAEFYQQFSNLQTDVRILISKNVIIYVLGTNHANTQCKDDVVDIIKKVRPRTVLVELCSLRACSCKKHRSNAFQSTPKFTFRYLRNIITQLGFLPAMIFFTDVFREHLVSENSLLHYGGEFIAAMATAQSIKNCRIVLADRPIEITVKRQASAMGNWRGLRVTMQVTLALMFKKRMKQLMLSANRLVFDDPKTYEVLVFERDLFLTHSIQEVAKHYEHVNSLCRVVAVIGQGHMHGIQTYWGKVPSEFIPFIMSPQTILDQ